MRTTVLRLIILASLIIPTGRALAQKTAPRMAKGQEQTIMRFDGPGNEYVEIYLLDSGQFSIGTTGGSPGRTTDDHMDLIYGHPGNGVGSEGGPWSSYTSFSINGTIYKNDYADYVATGPEIVGNTVQTSWVFDGVTIVQELSIVSGTTTGHEDAVRIQYRMTNGNTVTTDIGLRLMLDTMLGANDGAPFWIPGVGGMTQETEFLGSHIPQFYQVFDDLANPAVQAEGTLLGADATAPDRFVIGQWGGLNREAWDYTITPDTDISDSALAIWWDPVSVPAGASRTLVTFYGLAGVSVSSGDLTLGLTAPTGLSRSQSGALYPNPFDITAFVQNVTGNTVSNVTATLVLPAGLHLFSGTLEQSLGDVDAGAQRTAGWRVEADESIYGSIPFSVTLNGTGMSSHTVERTVQVAFPIPEQTDGDWTDQHVTLDNTPEAAIMVRTGDVDNLGFGWPSGFDPFDGNATPVHAFPWTVDPTDAPGTDRIMVLSSFNGSGTYGSDGYSLYTSRPGNDPEAVTLSWDMNGTTVTAATLQIFVDDFQAPVWRANYQVYLDGLRATFMEPVINSLVQTGPIGKLVTFDVPTSFLHLLSDGELSLFFDDPETGAGDGFAIDFVKLLINPASAVRRGSLTGIVRDATTSAAIEGVEILVNGRTVAVTRSDGTFEAGDVTSGLASVQTRLMGYGAMTTFVDIVADQTSNVTLSITSPAPSVVSVSPANGEGNVQLGASVRMTFDQHMEASTLGSASFTLSTADASVPGSFVVTDTSLEFVPDGMLVSGTTYTATLTVDAKNTAGVSLWQPMEWVFTAGTSVDVDADVVLPTSLQVEVWPNPFLSRLNLQVHLGEPADVRVEAYTLLGQRLMRWEAGVMTAGEHLMALDMGTEVSGWAILRITAGDEVITRSVVRMR